MDLDWVPADLAALVQQALEPAHTTAWIIDGASGRPVRAALHDHGQTPNAEFSPDLGQKTPTLGL